MAGGAPEFGLPGGFPRTGPTRTSIAVRRLEAAQDVELYRRRGPSGNPTGFWGQIVPNVVLGLDRCGLRNYAAPIPHTSQTRKGR
ncbi:hypothetical protein BH10ACT2_BH10ACT2_17240 [soil metagenome]